MEKVYQILPIKANLIIIILGCIKDGWKRQIFFIIQSFTERKYFSKIRDVVKGKMKI